MKINSVKLHAQKRKSLKKFNRIIKRIRPIKIKKLFAILNELENIYHSEEFPPILKHDEPLDGLILTVLSQNTNDKNRDAAFKNLKAKFLTWEQVYKAGAEKLQELIKPAGLAHTKSIRIINMLAQIYNDFKEFSLVQLKNFDRDYIFNYLINLKGVGLKTAACVLLFDMGLKAFPVDTHVTRVIHRTELAPENKSADEISLMLEKIVPFEKCLGGHVNIIQHGRNTCKARNPLCKNCVLLQKNLCAGLK